MDFTKLEVLIEEVFSAFSLIRGEGVDYSNLRDEGLIKVYFMIIWHDGGMWSVASFKMTEVNLEYLGGRVTLNLAFSAAMASLVAVVSLTMRGEPGGRNWKSQYIIQ